MRPSLAIVAVAVGGALGSTLRLLVGQWFVAKLGPGFPWGTFAINLSGAFILGIVIETAATWAGINPYLRLFLTTGVLGGYTTFSAYCYEAYALGTTGFMPAALAYTLSSVALGIVGIALGVSATRIIAVMLR